MSVSRRTFLAASAASLACGFAAQAAPAGKTERDRGSDLHNEFGITTGSFMMHLRKPAAEKFDMLTLPKIMRDELDLKVIDLMTKTIPYEDAAYCARFRDAAEQAGRVITNLKLNLDADAEIGSSDDVIRRRSLDKMKQGIDAAERLDCRWVRPATTDERPNQKLLVDGLRELVDYAAPKNITLLVENNGWIKNDAEALPRITAAVGDGIAVQPDTGNWNAGVRYDGLAKAFPLATTCDFKALALGPNMEHAEYDLRRCFDIAWAAGFRGPWCFEHFHEDLPSLFKDFVRLREQLQAWTKENSAKS
jgi:hypothetical protein